MSYGGYDIGAAKVRTQERVALVRQTIFSSRGCHELMNPLGLRFREALDSLEHPESRAIVWFVDVSKSMEDIPDELARRTLPKFVEMVLPILPDAQFLFGAVGDAEDGNDRAPLQIGQWESSDVLVEQWLLRIYLEGGGGDNRLKPSYESYDLPLFFSARMTQIDCYEKRGQRGYLFLSVDECPRERVSAQVVNRVFGRIILEKDLSLHQVIQEVAQKFHVFVLIPDLRRAEECEAQWRAYLGDNVITMIKPDVSTGSPTGADSSVVASTLIQLTEGKIKDDLAFAQMLEHSGCDQAQVSRVYRAVHAYAVTRPEFANTNRPAVQV